MKCIKEDIANIERAIENDKLNTVGAMPIVMADAVYQSEKAQEEIDKEMEKHNKKVKLNKVIGAEKQPVPDLPEKPKVVLDESLFEDYNEKFIITKVGENKYALAKGTPPVINSRINIEAESPEEAKEILMKYGYKDSELIVEDYNSVVRHYSDMLFDMIESNVVDAEQIAKDLIFWCSEDDIKRFMEVNDLIYEEEFDESLFEDYNTDTVAAILSGRKPMPKRGFKYLSSNGTSGEVMFNGTKYAFRELDDGSYKVMTSAAAGSNWSETLFKEKFLNEGRKKEERDLFTQILDDLSAINNNMKYKTKFPDVKLKNKYDNKSLGVAYRKDGFVDIDIREDSKEKLDFAKQVADAYGVESLDIVKEGDQYRLSIRVPEE